MSFFISKSLVFCKFVFGYFTKDQYFYYWLASISSLLLIFYMHPFLSSWIHSLLLLFSALFPNSLNFPRNEAVGTQHVVPGAASHNCPQRNSYSVLFCTGSLNLDFTFILPECLTGQNLTCTPLHLLGLLWHLWDLAPASQRTALYLDSLSSGVSPAMHFQKLAKLLFPFCKPHVSKAVCSLFLLPELLQIVSKLESLVKGKTISFLLFFHTGHK